MVSDRRPFVHPLHGDTIASVAARVLPDDPAAADKLQAWNPHLVMRRTPTGQPGLLGTDIVYLGPPAP